MIDIKTYNQAVEECTRFVQDPSNFMVKEHTHTSQQVEGLSSNLELLHQLDIKIKDHMNNETIHVTKEDKENWNSTFDRLEKYILQKFSEVDSLRIIVLGDGETHSTVVDPIEKAIYFEKCSEEDENIYDEYIYYNSSWERIGSNKINLSDYYNKPEIDSMLQTMQSNMDEKYEQLDNSTVKTDEFNQHVADDFIHVSAEEKDRWNANKVNVSSVSGNQIVEKPDGLYVAKESISTTSKNALQRKSNGLYVEDKTDEIQNIDEKIDRISEYERYINTDLDFIFASVSNSHAGYSLSTIGTKVPIDKIVNSNNMKINGDYSITLKAGHTYEICADYWVGSAETLNKGCTFSIKNITNNTCLCYIHKINGTPGIGIGPDSTDFKYFLNSDAHIIYTPTSDCNIAMVLEDVTSGGVNLPYLSENLISTYISVKEVSRTITIDPLNYVNEESGIEDTPVGHIIPYMGKTAPSHYLICDGTIYNISKYPYLAQHFKDEFGSINYFGGNGTTTFAVPDLRGEFLRGTGMNSHKNQGSGNEVGSHQDATENIHWGVNTSEKTFWTDTSTPREGTSQIGDRNADSYLSLTTGVNTLGLKTNLVTWSGSGNLSHYTTRPTNTSVLYCIKCEPTYFMKYVGFNSVVLFNGDAKTVGNYTLSGNITDYDYILVEISSGHSNSSFVPTGYSDAGKTTRLIKVSDIHIASHPTAGSDIFLETQWFQAAKKWYYFISYWFTAANKFHIDELYSENFVTPRIKKITGIKGGI